MSHGDAIDERAIELIARRVARALRDELADIAAGLGNRNGAESVMTVNDVAERFCVSRSTVYAHWREWGGYKLGTGDKSAIRFRPSSLPTQPSKLSQSTRPTSRQPGRARRERRPRVVLRGEPRLPTEFESDLTDRGSPVDRANPARPYHAAGG